MLLPPETLLKRDARYQIEELDKREVEEEDNQQLLSLSSRPQISRRSSKKLKIFHIINFQKTKCTKVGSLIDDTERVYVG